ncbi:TolB family protein [Aquimarina brevivitae]|nr:DPP IV N-terminal domain-containing protein [Aquimarina brevivitae]
MNKLIALLSLSLLIMSCQNSSEKIIFSSSRNGNSDIFMMDLNGENQLALTQTEDEEWGPTWMNEKEISFLRQNETGIKRIQININTLQETELPHPTNCILDDKNILYSPLNQLQLYSCKNDIFIYDPDTKQIENITKDIAGQARYPSWSADGHNIAYTSNHLGSNDVFLYDVKTKNSTQLTDTPANNERGELSADGQRLVYSSDQFEEGNQDILLQELSTGNIINITKSPGMELIARFSKDGNTIWYGTNKDGNWEIYAYDLATKKHTRLTNEPAFDGDPRIFKRK